MLQDLLLMALRSLSQDLGYFVESAKKAGSSFVIKRTVGTWILKYGIVFT